MPKRRCPFDVTFSPQLKVHLSDKEVYFNKNGTSVTTDIHAKTMERLFQGAMKSTQDTVVPSCEHEQQNLVADNSHRYRQLRLGNQGQLVNTTDVCTKNYPAADQEKPMEQICCNYCEIPLKCVQCQRVCQNCTAIFCQNCCLEMFTGNGNTSICLTCAR